MSDISEVEVEIGIGTAWALLLCIGFGTSMFSQAAIFEEIYNSTLGALSAESMICVLFNVLFIVFWFWLALKVVFFIARARNEVVAEVDMGHDHKKMSVYYIKYWERLGVLTGALMLALVCWGGVDWHVAIIESYFESEDIPISISNSTISALFHLFMCFLFAFGLLAVIETTTTANRKLRLSRKLQ